MGKSSKGKEKKLKRKEDAKKEKEVLNIVKEANKVENPFDELKPFHAYTKNGLQISLECRKMEQVSEDDFQALFSLVEDNMKSLYEQSRWGWSEKEKKEEMKEENARYLIARDSTNEIIAMSHFRFDIEDLTEVIYCYEIQLKESVRGKGLGKFMMQILELLAIKAKMKKVMFTVFKENVDALQFFTNMKYKQDDTSPRICDPNNPHDYDYEILSKTFNR